jgi:hypothetical protein
MKQVHSNVTNSNVISHDVLFPDGRHTTLVEAAPTASTKDIINKLGLITQGAVTPKAVILIVGGTSIVDAELQARLFQLFSRGLARAILSNSALLIEGSAEGGVITALGKALLERSNKASLLGIGNDDEISWPGRDGVDGASGHKILDSTYTHFVVVQGTSSDVQMDTLFGIAEELSQDIPILTILVNDSPNDSTVARDEVVRSVRQGWPVLVIGGSGGFADEIQRAWWAKQDALQGYIQELSQWRVGDPNKPQLILPFISDPVLAEVIAEGDLHFFPITEAPEKLELYIDLRLKANDILSQAETQRKVYSDAAKQQERVFHRLQFWVLLLGVLITALAVLKSVSGSAPFFSNILYYTLIGLPVLLALLIAGANRFDPGNRWIKMRAATESFKREMFRYRTRTGMYTDIQVVQNKTTREATLATMLEAISRQWVESNLDVAIFPAITRYPSAREAQKGSTPQPLTQGKPSEQGKPNESLSVYLPPNRYIEKRVVDQLKFYKDRTRRLGRKLTWLNCLILGLGGLATLLAALHYELVITVTTATATALVTYLEYNQTANTLKQYNHAILTLTNIQNWWVALEDGQADQENIDKLVDYVETTLQSEQVGWVQQMQTALTELRAQQAKQGADSSAIEPIHKNLEGQLDSNKSQNGKQSSANL